MQAVLPHIQNLYELYQLFAEARVKRGAIDFDTVETRIVCNPLGKIERIEDYTRNDAHKLIEACMLEIGRASCREGVSKYVKMSVDAVTLKKTKNKIYTY